MGRQEITANAEFARGSQNVAVWCEFENALLFHVCQDCIMVMLLRLFFKRARLSLSLRSDLCKAVNIHKNKMLK